ncbi:hypothetical protein LTR16_000195 [Cryomyces antarcticus]|uniref:Uncharacterized protein n=1 Tax=Cryomyces antarcticus TaxID=329879 RepID=A0ABR0KUU3_9PEZI|nr:hypothetical protein LTR39_000244 [Cryomyces antarcticus]KAK5020976.1 hypothetical protein LTR60_000172 [Cryomyces antarcticus]KAK5131974.1 hypothetical protein LTR16_000195 [Cryomyces antarcticus]
MADLPPNGPREGANIDDINSLGPKLLTEAELRADVAELAAWSEQQKRLREDEDALLEDLKDDPDLSEKFEALLLMDRMKRRVIRDGPQPGNYKYSAATGRFVEAEPKHRDHRLGIADRQNPGQFLPPKFDPHNPDTYPVSDLRSTINRAQPDAQEDGEDQLDESFDDDDSDDEDADEDAQEDDSDSDDDSGYDDAKSGSKRKRSGRKTKPAKKAKSQSGQGHARTSSSPDLGASIPAVSKVESSFHKFKRDRIEEDRLFLTIRDHVHHKGELRSYPYTKEVDWSDQTCISRLNKWKAQIQRRCTGKTVRNPVVAYLDEEKQWILDHRTKNGSTAKKIMEDLNAHWGGKVIKGEKRPQRTAASIGSELRRQEQRAAAAAVATASTAPAPAPAPALAPASTTATTTATAEVATAAATATATATASTSTPAAAQPPSAAPTPKKKNSSDKRTL